MLSMICEYDVYAATNTGLTRNQRMHSVYRDELLSQGVGNALVVNTGTWDTADGFTSLRDAADYLSKSLTNDAPPVRGHANLERRMSQDCRSPLYCVDFGHESTVDDACFVKDLVTGQCQHESCVRQGYTYPFQLGWPL